MSQFDLRSQKVEGNQYIAGRNIYFRPPLSLSEKQQQNYRAYLINQVRFSWIKGVLEPSLGAVAPIRQELRMRPDLVVNPFYESVQESNQPPRNLPPQTSIVQVYDQANGRLLILGEPGAGKTILLLELARDLLDRADADETSPLPVVFHLSSWAGKRQPLADWLVEELKSKYCVQEELARASIAANDLVVLLDGLDEVIPAARAACVEAINTYQKEHGPCPMILCSRSAEYMALPHHVELNSAVMVLPLTQEQIDTYLWSMGERAEVVRRDLQNDARLQELASTPLMLNVLTQASQGEPVEMLAGSAPSEIQRQLFKIYVQRMLGHRKRDAQADQTVHWLTWLAQQMIRHHQTVFYIEDMQPDWLSDERRMAMYRRSVQWALWLLIALFVGLPFAVFLIGIGLQFQLPLIAQIVLQVVVQFLVILNLGLPLTLRLRRGNRLAQITLREKYSWSWIGRRRFILSWLLGAAICGPLFGWMFGLAFKNWDLGLGVGLFIAFIFVPVAVMSSGWLPKQLDTHTRLTPNQGIWRSGRSGLMFGLFGCVIGGGISGLLSYAYFGPWWGLFLGSCVGGTGGILFTGIGFGFGLDAFLEHFVLRFWLWRENAFPWHYPRFLDAGADRLLLHKVGGGYIFIHHLLLDYLASLETTRTAAHHGH